MRASLSWGMDERLRRLERLAAAGDQLAEAALLHQRLGSRDLSPTQLGLAAYPGQLPR